MAPSGGDGHTTSAHLANWRGQDDEAKPPQARINLWCGWKPMGTPPVTLGCSLAHQPETAMRRIIFGFLFLLAACGPRLPAPNSADARYDERDRAVQVLVSGLQPPSAVTLVATDGTRYPASGIALLSGPHVLYNPPASISFGIGGFGFTGCCSAIGSGVGVGVPVGRPTVGEVSDQYVASALIPVPPDYASNWSQYRVEVSPYHGTVMDLPAPAPHA